MERNQQAEEEEQSINLEVAVTKYTFIVTENYPII